jgi:hypothetical protein
VAAHEGEKHQQAVTIVKEQFGVINQAGAPRIFQ